MKKTPRTIFPVFRMLLFAAIGVGAGYLMVASTTDTQARTGRGVSGRDFANLVACCEANDDVIIELLPSIMELEDQCLEPTGACCVFVTYDSCGCDQAPQCLDGLTALECEENLGGTYQGDGSVCDEYTCDNLCDS